MKTNTFNLMLISVLLISLLSFNSCKSSTKVLATTEQVNDLKNLVESRQFTIHSDVAYPRVTYAMAQLQNSGLLAPGNSINRISLIGNPNHLTISGDSITSQLPYFGERQSGSAYNTTDIGISLEGEMRGYESIWEEDNMRYIIRFKANDKNESYDVVMYVFPNNSCSMTLTGTRRFSIDYRGMIVSEVDLSQN